MSKIDPCETMRNNLIAAAVGLQKCTGADANLVPLLGTEKYVAIGTAADVSRLLANQAAKEPVADEPEAYQWRHHLAGDKGWSTWQIISKGRYDRRAEYPNSQFRVLYARPAAPVEPVAIPAGWMEKFEELLEDYAGARAETAVFNATQRSGMTVRMEGPRLKALRDLVRPVFVAAAPSPAPAAVKPTGDLLAEILALAKQGMSHGLLADDLCSQIVAKIEGASESAGAAEAMTEQAEPGQRIFHQPMLEAIQGAITYGRMGINPPPSPEHWGNEFWQIGRQLAKLGETSAWDNVTPVDSPAGEALADIGTDAQFASLLMKHAAEFYVFTAARDDVRTGDISNEKVVAAKDDLVKHLNDRIAAARVSASAPAGVARDAVLPLFTCKGKGGRYEVLGYANGAGTKRGETVVVYQPEGDDGALYFRTRADFEARMEEIPAASNEKGGDHE